MTLHRARRRASNHQTQIVLRDGSSASDSRLARLLQFDDRSRSYPVRRLFPTTDARNYTWRCGTHLDQGREGACVGFACTHALIARRPTMPRLTAKFATQKVYWEAQRNDQWDGGAYPKARPKYDGTSVLEGIKALSRLGYVASYHWAFGLRDLIRAVSWIGPAVLGLWWYESMQEPHDCGYLHVTGERAGGHAILCKGVNVDERYFIVHNSWGPKWGRQGDARISFAEMDKLLDDEGEAVVPIFRRSARVGERS